MAHTDLAVSRCYHKHTAEEPVLDATGHRVPTDRKVILNPDPLDQTDTPSIVIEPKGS